MVTQWQYRLILIAPDAANTQVNRNAFAQVFVDEGSGESLADEKLMFTNAPRLALASAPTVQVARGCSVAVKGSMRTALQSAFSTINTPLASVNKLRWYAIANVDLPQHSTGWLLATNYGSTAGVVDTPFTWQDALDDFNLVVMDDGL